MRAFTSFLEPWLLTCLLNSLWQVPLVYCAAWIAARLARPAGVYAEHSVWVGALFLQVTLPLCHMELNEIGRRAWSLILWSRHTNATDGQVRVLLGPATALPVPVPWLTASLLTALAAAYLLSVFYFACRLAWGAWITESIRRRSTKLQPQPELAARLASCASHLGIDVRTIQVAVSTELPGPATVGILRQTLLVPPGFLERLSTHDLDAVLAHELAHMRRRDFPRNLLYGMLALPVAYHPLLWLTRERIAESREMVCDAIAARSVGGREPYAKSLLNLASLLSHRNAPALLHAVGIFDANILERRVMHLTRTSLPVARTRRVGIATACALIALATCTSALALRIGVMDQTPQHPNPAMVHVKATSMRLVSKIPPVYPVEAKKDRLSGSVILTAIIGKDGAVERLDIKKSLRGDCDQSALDAVRQWRYEPFLLNGKPVEVETTITITYRLASKPASL